MALELRLYYSPYCPHCRGAVTVVEEAARSLGVEAAVEPCNILEHIEAAVAAGIRQTPALTLDGRIIACGRLDTHHVAYELEQRLMEHRQ